MTSGVRRRGWPRATGGLLAFVLAVPMAVAAPIEGPLETVVFQPGDTIRGVAERYLKDPDLWPQILELSGVPSTAELRPGTELLVPVQQVAAADDALAVSLAAIQKATAEGARLFAPREIGSAIANRDTAVEHRDAGDWAEVVTYAGTAAEFADRALAISLAERDRAAEAVVSDAQGAVEGRAPEQPLWSPRATNDVLVEFERVRTLSASTAQLTFRDLSRLRLNPNSNAVIQRMRSDPLTGGEVTKVSLVNGDFYALLNQLGGRSGFEVSVPGVETATRSADFWIKHEGDASRFANYDAPPLEITRGAETISVGENEGAVVPAAGAAERAEVLARAELEAPYDGAELYDAVVTLTWRRSEGAEGYWLEVAADADFNVMQASEWGVRGTSHTVQGLEAGDHYWRVSSLDRLGLPGVRSLSWRFRLLQDDTPPFLTILAPKDGEIVAAAEVPLEGESEPDARVSVNGGHVAVADNGGFATTVQAAVGANTVRVEAVDPAGNRTERSRGFVYRPGGAVTIAFDSATPRDAEGRLLTRTGEIDVAGTSDAEEASRVRVSDAQGAPAVQTLVEPGGAFHFTVPATEAGVAYRLEVLGPGGQVEGSGAFEVRRDAEPPEIALDAPPPSATADAWLDIAGSAGDAATVLVNGAVARLADGRFDAVASLAPGPNGIEIVATDAVGNVTVQRLETVHDVEPPEILSAAARRPEGEAGPIEVVVEARDGSGLRQAAPFVLGIGGSERRGFLRCDSAAGACREVLPPEPGALTLIEVAVEDYAGNVARRQE
jgi:hypothetical protein